MSDRQRATITLVDRGGHVLWRKSAEHYSETRDGQCYVTFENPWVNLVVLSLGGMLLEISNVQKKTHFISGTSERPFDLSSKSVRVFTAVDTEPDAAHATEVERDEIDIYEFLRTYQPGAVGGATPDEDSSDIGQQSEDGEPQVQLDEPYVMVRPFRSIRMAVPDAVDL